MKLDQNKIYNMFLKDTNVDRLQKILSKYELFKKIINIPGDICECGVFKGSGIFTWVKLVMLFKPNNNFKVVGFDFFEKKYNQMYTAGNPFATPTNIPSNIEGGALGIWAGFSPWTDTLICQP